MGVPHDVTSTAPPPSSGVGPATTRSPSPAWQPEPAKSQWIAHGDHTRPVGEYKGPPVPVHPQGELATREPQRETLGRGATKDPARKEMASRNEAAAE